MTENEQIFWNRVLELAKSQLKQATYEFFVLDARLIQIEQKDKKGFFGIGKKRARVNIEPIHEDTVRQADRLATRGLSADFIAESPKVQSAMEATVELSQVVKAVKAAEKASAGELSQEDRDAIIEEAKLEIAEKKILTQSLDTKLDEASSTSTQNKVIKIGRAHV